MRVYRIGRIMLFALVVSATALCSSQTSTENRKEYIDPDGYEVLSTVVANSRHACPLTAIVDETRPVADIASLIAFKNPKHEGKWLVLAAKYDRVNAVPFRLLPRFSPRGRYTLLPQATSAGREGQLLVSAVAFDEKKTLALVSTLTVCGCARSNALLLEKRDGKWQEVKWPGEHFGAGACR